MSQFYLPLFTYHETLIEESGERFYYDCTFSRHIVNEMTDEFFRKGDKVDQIVVHPNDVIDVINRGCCVGFFGEFIAPKNPRSN